MVSKGGGLHLGVDIYMRHICLSLRITFVLYILNVYLESKCKYKYITNTSSEIHYVFEFHMNFGHLPGLQSKWKYKYKMYFVTVPVLKSKWKWKYKEKYKYK